MNKYRLCQPERTSQHGTKLSIPPEIEHLDRAN